MHRLILQAPIGIQVDHKNHNGLDNRRFNIRLCTCAQNNHNRQAQGGSSKFKGVYWHYDKRKNWGRWGAQISIDGKNMALGYFHNETDAANAYDRAAIKHFGEFAKTNKMLGLLNNERSTNAS